jgi:hypothetical protein
MSSKNVCLCLALALVIAPCAYPAPIFSDDFDLPSPVAVTTTSTSGNYSVAVSLANNNKATFGYDYGAAGLGIPPAPNSVGTSKGLRLDPNNGGTATIGALAVSPTASFPGDIEIKYDLWMNSIAGGAGVTWNNGGTGSSEAITTGVGYNGATTQYSASGSGVWFHTIGDGGFASGNATSPDYGAWVNGSLQSPTTGVYAAGTATAAPAANDNANSYYTTLFPGQPTPAGQTPVATADNGTLLFKWHAVRVDRIGNTVTWYVDNNLIATVTNAASTATDRIVIGSWDPGTSQDAGHVFSIVDNLSISAIPEPTSCTLCLASLFGFAGLRARRNL